MKPRSLKDLLEQNTGSPSLLSALLGGLLSDEFGATKGCDCPGCKLRREEAKAEKPEPTDQEEEEEGFRTLEDFLSQVFGIEGETVEVTGTIELEYDQETDILDVGVAKKGAKVLVRADKEDENLTVLSSREARKLAIALLKASELLDE